MEKVVEIIQKIIDSDLIIKELCFIPKQGVSVLGLEKWNFFKDYGQENSSSYILFLKKWNGIDIDVIRFFGVSSNENIPEIKFDQEHSLLIIASDPAGFLYGMDNEGKIYSLDTESNTKKLIAPSFDDFILQFVFSSTSQDFLGIDWCLQLKEIGIV